MSEKDLTVADGVVVSLDYTLRLDDGEIIDSSEGQSPLEYLHGQGNIIPGLEKALVGMSAGDEKEVMVQAAEAYGEVDMDAFQIVPRSTFPEDMDLEEGMGLNLRDAQSGQPVQATIAEIRDEGVMLDFNHPLAGETLHFQVKIPALRRATAEEMSHGHVHHTQED